MVDKLKKEGLQMMAFCDDILGAEKTTLNPRQMKTDYVFAVLNPLFRFMHIYVKMKNAKVLGIHFR